MSEEIKTGVPKMKSFLIGILYTVVVAGALVHFSGCNVPELSEITALLTPAPAVTATPTPVAAAEGEKKNVTTTPAAHETATSDGFIVTETDDYVWSTGSVNLRKGPGTEYDKVDTISKNTKVHRTGICENGWIRIDYKDSTAFMSGKYYTTTEPDVTKAPGTTSTPTPKAEATASVKATSAPTLTPVAKAAATATPGTLPAVNDDPDTVLALMTSVSKHVDTAQAAAQGFYYETEKAATADFLKKTSTLTTFTMLYKDKTCMHTPEYLMATYPELYKVEIDYSNSVRYANAICVVYNVSTKEGGQYAYAIRTGNTSFLTEEELYALKEIKKLSGSLGLEKLSNIEAVKTVHDYLINNTRYDSAYNKQSHTPYGLLTNKVAVCDGYSETFMIFMLLNDIECQTVTGYASEDHAWNQICLDGEWYNIDVTWDDPIVKNESGEDPDVLRYNYFVVNDEVLSETHRSTCGYEKKCTSDKYNLYTYKQYYCDSDDEVRAQIEAQKGNDRIFFLYRSGRYTKGDIVKIFQGVYNVGLTSYAPVEIRKGYMFYEMVNPLK